jgi:DNA-binding NtrC family response regulator
MSKPVILLIDDDKVMLNSLMDQLRHAYRGDYTIEAVQTISEARNLLEMLAEQNIPVKLIISDWLMPPDRTNGLLVEIHTRWPNINLIMLSGYADEDAVQHARDHANLKAFVRKPWEEDELINEIEKAIA